MYSIKEIYFTIQGEGHHTGRPAVFCRFSGCNLWTGREIDRKSAVCNFCDTDFIGTDGQSGSKYDTAKLLVNEILSYWPDNSKPFVVLTGGEPMLQVNKELLKELKDNNFEIAIETNGTLKVPSAIDWICVSPKTGSELIQLSGDELKIVYPQNKFNLHELISLDFKYFFLQPKYNHLKKLNVNKTIDYCKLNKPWFPSFQLHKTIGIM